MARAVGKAPVRKRAARNAARAGDAPPANDAEASPSGMPPRAALWATPGFLVRRLAQIHYALFFDECKDYNVTPVQYGVIFVLQHSPGLDQASLGAELGLDRATVTEVLGRLSNRDLVARKPGDVDRRRKLVYLTPAGLALADDIYHASQRCAARLLDPLGKSEAARFMKTLTKLVESNNRFGRTLLNPNFDRLSMRKDEG